MLRPTATAMILAAFSTALAAQNPAPMDPETRGFAETFRVGFALQGEKYPNANTQTSILFERTHTQVGSQLLLKTF